MVEVGRIRVWETRLISDKIRKVGDLLRGRKGNQWSFVVDNIAIFDQVDIYIFYPP
jgi:hypothetical protein